MSNNKVSERNDLEQPLLSREESVEEPTAEEVLDGLPEQDIEPLISEPVAAEIIRVTDAEVVVADTIASENETSTGQWKSGLFTCCAHGCFHPSFILPFCGFPLSKFLVLKTPHGDAFHSTVANSRSI